jgi:hypothetical protein
VQVERDRRQGLPLESLRVEHPDLIYSPNVYRRAGCTSYFFVIPSFVRAKDPIELVPTGFASRRKHNATFTSSITHSFHASQRPVSFPGRNLVQV